MRLVGEAKVGIRDAGTRSRFLACIVAKIVKRLRICLDPEAASQALQFLAFDDKS